MRHSDPKFRAVTVLTGIFVSSLASLVLPQVCEVNELEKLTPIAGAAADCFGRSVSLAGDWLIVGGCVADVAGADAGGAYLFRRDDAGTPTDPDDDSWVDVTRVSPRNANPEHGFGKSVAINGGWAAVGPPPPLTGVPGKLVYPVHRRRTWLFRAGSTRHPDGSPQDAP